MFIISIGVYIFVLTGIIGFFVVEKIHVYKFKNFSQNIEKYTKMIFGILLILSILGIISIFYLNSKLQNTTVDEATSTESVYY